MGDGGLGGEDEGTEVGEGGGAEGGGRDEDVEDAEVHEIKIEVQAGKGVDLKKDLPVFIGWIPGGPFPVVGPGKERMVFIVQRIMMVAECDFEFVGRHGLVVFIYEDDFAKVGEVGHMDYLDGFRIADCAHDAAAWCRHAEIMVDFCKKQEQAG